MMHAQFNVNSLNRKGNVGMFQQVLLVPTYCQEQVVHNKHRHILSSFSIPKEAVFRLDNAVSS